MLKENFLLAKKIPIVKWNNIITEAIAEDGHVEYTEGIELTKSGAKDLRKYVFQSECVTFACVSYFLLL